MKYPPMIEPGSPVSACQRSAAVIVAVGTGTTNTLAFCGRCNAAKVADQPAGSGIGLAAGRGSGSSGRQATTATAVATAPAHRAAALRAPADHALARSSENASSAAAAPSATIDSLLGSAVPITGTDSSQCQGSVMPGSVVPPTSG